MVCFQAKHRLKEETTTQKKLEKRKAQDFSNLKVLLLSNKLH
jgi:hypothetical protein